MSYRKRITELRRLIEIYWYNTKQVENDIIHYKEFQFELLEEHNVYMDKIRQYEAKIEALQPWWRKFLGVRY